MNQLELIGAWLVIIGLILFFIKKHWAQKGKTEAKGKTARCLAVVANILSVVAILMFTYVVTDTFLEWCLVSILFGSALGINYLLSLLIKGLKKKRWLIPVIAVPIATVLYCIIIQAIAAFCITNDYMGFAMGICAAFLGSIINATKENEAYRKAIRIESFIIYFLVTWGLYNVQLPTKPMRLIKAQVKTIMKPDERIEIYEKRRDIERGREGILMVCLSGKNRLSEIQYYTYFKGEIAKIPEEQIVEVYKNKK